MHALTALVDFILHIDTHLQAIITQFGALTYAILFAIVFVETGLVIMPFLPGDSLLFAAGAFAARGALQPMILFVLLAIAAIVGDTVNYALGRRIGPRVFRENSKFLNQKHLLKAEAFYEKYGGKTIILARFIPIIRTLAPFVAGVGKMHYRTFISYNVVGALLWVGLFVWGGYFFGTIPAVEEHFSLVIIVIIGLSILPPVIEWVRGRIRARAH